MAFMDSLVNTQSTYNDALLGVGVTQAFLDRTVTLRDELRAANVAQEGAKRDRRKQTKERIQALNKLYKGLKEVEDLARFVFRNDLPTAARYFIPRYSHTPSETTGEIPEGVPVSPNTKTDALSGILVEENQSLAMINRGDISLTFYVANSTEAQVASVALTLEPGQQVFRNSNEISDGDYGMLIVWNASSATIGRYEASAII